jgi:hypothetical protein
MLHRVVQLSVLLTSVSWLAAEDHWAFQPLKPGRGASMDEFIHRKLTEKKLPSSPRAEARTLIRRATFDLTGLPPTPEEVATFMHDHSPDAYARLIDRLLASPHHGEHWARHWLDVARYSDTKGYVYAREEKMWVHATPYRDWVVRALNDDMPYDHFLRLQIAADQLVPPGSPDLAAMGFLTLGRRFLGVTHDIIDDRIDVLTRGTLGLTVACARCHDHKFDPVPTRDYYALYGVFQSSAETVVPCSQVTASVQLIELQKKNRELMTKRREEQMTRNRARLQDYLQAQKHLYDYPEEVFSQILDEKDLNPFVVHRWKAWLEKNPGVEITEAMLKQPDSPAFVPDEHIANIEMYFPTGITTDLWKAQGDVDRFILKNSTTAPTHATVLTDRARPNEPRVFVRGSPLNKGDSVPRQFLSVFGKQQPFTHGSGRLELAAAITDSRNPLTARVMVNRLWQHHFGRGLVSTPSDFGTQGSPPTHPELLDWLAQKFIDSGWSMKTMHRLIMLSETYRKASFPTRSEDPENHYLAHFPVHRLTFEEARDAWLMASGQLNLEVGGQPQALFAVTNTRRTLYALVDRENLPAVMRTFDFANPDLSIPQRSETTVPQQALFSMNHPFIVQQARALLNRPEIRSDFTMKRLEFIYQVLFQRSPTHRERKDALRYVLEEEEKKIPLLAEADHSKSWQYGYGEWDESKGSVKDFQPLPHFTGSAWQGDEAWPNEKLGWAQLTATGGHPGNDRKHAVVRRWIAPADGTYAVKSSLLHEPSAGDGIRSFISHSQQGRLHAGKLHQGSADLNFDTLTFSKGDTLDFIVDIDKELNSDQFLWSVRITPSGPIIAGNTAETWDAEKDFSAQPNTKLNAWEQLVQVLMLANEFMFVD